MSKTIIFCADGTWNGTPNAVRSPQAHSAVAADTSSELGEGLVGCTNVYRLFDCLEGTIDTKVSTKKEQEKNYLGPGVQQQIAKYVHGVGDSENVVQRFAEGAFGIGVVARIARGYTYISRNYVPGDEIVIVGFSRGAYTARALCGLIATMGLLSPQLAVNPNDKYSNAFAAWDMYRRQKHTGTLDDINDFFVRVSEKRLFNKSDINAASFVFGKGVNVKAVGVWDTVGSLGIPFFDLGDPSETVDLFQFADTGLSDKVLNGFHAVSVDEMRPPFTPTLWDNRVGIIQRLFAGAHADVGGGYNEHGLANIALRWMIEMLTEHAQLSFDPIKVKRFVPDCLDVAHQPWKLPGYELINPKGRKFSASTNLEVDPSVVTRMNAEGVCPDPKEVAQPYRPPNISAFLR